MTTINIHIDPNEFKPRLGRGFKTDAENISHNIRSRMQLASHERLRAKHLAKCLGIRLLKPVDLSWTDQAQFEEHFSLLRKHWSAFLLPEAGHKRIIVSNPASVPERQESDLFHEIAHVICDHKPKPINLVGEMAMRCFDDEDEKQAEFLGYALHLSKDALFHSLKQGFAQPKICETYRASQELVRHRINLTQVATILQRSRLKFAVP